MDNQSFSEQVRSALSPYYFINAGQQEKLYKLVKQG